MSFFPFSTLFMSTLILGSVMALSSSHWVLVWVGLELNLISFIPLLFLSESNNENEGAMKYFLAQALGSSLILIGGSNLYMTPFSITPMYLSYSMILFGLLTKIGLPPCHFWFPSVMTSLSWPMCFLLSSWQKVAPLFLFIYLSSFSSFLVISLVIFLSSMCGGLGGLTQSLLKPMLSYSSIGHMSWIIAAGVTSYSMSLIYLCAMKLYALHIYQSVMGEC